MKRIGKWLTLIGFGVPLLISIVGMSLIFTRAIESGAAGQQRAIAAEVSRNMTIAMMGIPIGVIGVGCWIVGAIQGRRPHP